jgi:hypothetical protein
LPHGNHGNLLPFCNGTFGEFQTNIAMKEQILLQITPEELKTLIEESFSKAISKIPKETEDDKLMSRGEVALLFRVSLVTINAWCRKGKLKPRHMNSRVYFFKSEVMAELLKQKK